MIALIFIPFRSATTECATSWISTPAKSPSETAAPSRYGMYLPVIRLVSIATPKTSLSRDVVSAIWVPMIQAKSGITSTNVQWSSIGIPKSRPMRSEPSM